MHSSRLMLGTAQFALPYGVANAVGIPSRGEVASILSKASADGIVSLDTAISYGECERLLGDAGVSDFDVTTKLPAVPDGVKAEGVSSWVDSQIRGALGRLRVDQIDAVLLHRPTQMVTEVGDALYRALCLQKDLGHVRRIGISIYDPSELDALISRFDLDVVQAPFNILDSRLLNTGWIDRLQNLGVSLHVRSIFLQGLLLMSKSQRPAYFHRWDSLWDRWDAWLQEHDLTALRATLRFALHAPGVEKVVLGVDSRSQLAQIIAVAGEGPLPDGYQSLSTTDVELLNPSLWKLN